MSHSFSLKLSATRGRAAIISGVIAISLVLGSCKSVEEAHPAGQVSAVYLTNVKKIQLLGPETLTGPIDSFQHIEGRYQNTSYFMDVYVKADSSGLSMIALNSFGTQLFDFSYTGDRVALESAMATGGLKPEYVVADFQLCYYPEEAVRAQLEAAGLRLVTVPVEDGGSAGAADETRVHRKIFDGETLIIDISFSGKELRYRNLLRDYSYTLTEIEQ